MLSSIIIDDEEKARTNLSNLLKDYCQNVEVLDSVGSVKDAVDAVNTGNPDLIFLDVKMQGETGFDFLQQIDEINFEIIFVTAFDQYATKAFKFCAIDYLLKPININELKDAVEKVEKKKEKEFDKDKVTNLLENLKNKDEGINKLALSTLEGLTFVQLSDIIRCESSDNYTMFFLVNGERIMVSKTIKHFEELLSSHNFLRTHQSHLINLAHIKKYVKGDGGYVIMSDDSSVLISRRKKDDFLEKLSNI